MIGKRNVPVVDSGAVQLHWEKGECSDLTSPKVAIVSSWSDTAVMSRSLSAYLAALDSEGYQPFVVSTCEVKGALEWPFGLPNNAVVARRRNIGYDFGSWASALSVCSELARKPYVLLTNDSLVGPFGPLADMFERAENASEPVVFMTESLSPKRHGQSFFILFKDRALSTPALTDFFNSVAPQRTKQRVIDKYEIPLAQTCEANDLPWQAIYSAEELGAGHINPTLSAWRQLIAKGAPFLKRQILLAPEFDTTAVRMRHYAARSLREDLRDWLPPTLVDQLPGSTTAGPIGGSEIDLPPAARYQGVLLRSDSEPADAALAPGWTDSRLITDVEAALCEQQRQANNPVSVLVFTAAAAAQLPDDLAEELQQDSALFVLSDELPRGALPGWATGWVQCVPSEGVWVAPPWTSGSHSPDSSAAVSYRRLSVGATANCLNQSAVWPSVYFPAHDEHFPLGLELVDYTQESFDQAVSRAARLTHELHPQRPFVFALRGLGCC